MPDVERRGDAQVLVAGLDAEREDPDPVDLGPAGEEAQPAERQQPAVHLREHLVDVGQREGGADHLSVALGDHRPVLVQDRLQVLGLEANLGLGDRYEAPVVPPGLVIDVHEPGDLGLQIALAHLADDHAVLGGRLPRRAVDEIVELVALLELPHRQPPHPEVHRLGHAQPLEQLPVVRRVPRLEDQRLELVALDQHAALVVGGEVHRAEHPIPAPGAHPLCRGLDQSAPDLGVVDRLEEPEHAVIAALELGPALVDLGGDPAHDLAAALGDEVLGFGVAEEGVLVSIQESAPVEDQRRHPRGVAVEAEGQLYEPVEVPPARHRTHCQRCHRGGTLRHGHGRLGAVGAAPENAAWLQRTANES